MYTLDLNKPCKIYFVGIGGISMSGLALILIKEGFDVSGTDRDASEVTRDLEAKGIKINIGHKPENITADIDVLVYTAAVKADNPELVRAGELGIKSITRAELLGAIMENYKNSITISGTHGKTTTTSMLALILMEYTDPTVSIGGILPAIKSNVHLGNSDVFVAEACEYTNSFYSFYPKYSVILNIEEDHPDFFKDLDDIRHSFKTFAGNTKSGGTLFINSAILNPGYITDHIDAEVFTYGLEEDADLTAKDIESDRGRCSFTPVYKGQPLCRMKLMVPGMFNVVNALGAISVCIKMGVPEDAISRGLARFTGAHRRMEYRGIYNGATVIDDYAHHPTEISASLSAAREYSPNRLIVTFQPHTYTRTEAFFDDFVEALSAADLILLCEIYAAREDNVNNISSLQITDALVKKGCNSLYFSTMDDALKFLEKNLIHDDLLITMGAGNIHYIADCITGS